MSTARDHLDDWLQRNTDLGRIGRALTVNELIDGLADAGILLVADADGSEDAAAHALRAAARAFVDGYGIDGPKHLSDVPLWLIARADLIDSFAATDGADRG